MPIDAQSWSETNNPTHMLWKDNRVEPGQGPRTYYQEPLLPIVMKPLSNGAFVIRFTLVLVECGARHGGEKVSQCLRTALICNECQKFELLLLADTCI